MEYFRIEAAPSCTGIWFLEEPTTAVGESIDARNFTSGQRYSGPSPAFVPIEQEGDQVQFSLGAFDLPLVSESLGEVIQGLAPKEVELFPVLLDSTIPGFEILNVQTALDCLDESRSEIMRWSEGDDRPEMVGRYRMVTDLRIDPSAVMGTHIFRIKNWEIALIVSAQLKEAMEHFSNLGVVFNPVA